MTALSVAYQSALANPAVVAEALGLQSSPTLEEVRSAFLLAFKQFSPSGLECEVGRRRFEEGVQLFFDTGNIPDFVARHYAGINVGESVAA